jgi:hypothetical protein
MIQFHGDGGDGQIGEYLIPKLKTMHQTNRLTISLLIVLMGTCVAAWAVPLEPAALEYARIRQLADDDPNLTGRGVLIAAVCRSMTYINDKAQNDYRINTNHNSLYRSDVAFADGTDGRFGISSHATAVAGILIGRDDNAQTPASGPFEYRGVCPEASVDIYEFWRFATMHLFDAQHFEADIVTLSLGEKYEDWWTRAVENLAVEKNLIVIASIGNGQQAYDLLYPGAGANSIGVGVVNAAVDENGAVSLYEFSAPRSGHSSFGPTDDLRCKPDIVAPGTALIPVHNNSADYVVAANWSSLAAPVVSGTTALLLQKIYADEALAVAFDRPGKNAVIKAVLLNSAAKLPYWHKGGVSPDDDERVPLDYQQGAGAVDAAAALKQITAGLRPPGDIPSTGWDNRMLDVANAPLTYTLRNVDPNQMITATLCWNYHYQNTYPFDHQLELDNNLRLELWGIDPADPDIETLLSVSDSFNDNVEHIYIAPDERFSDYRLRVLYSPAQAAETITAQRYALAWSVRPDTAIGNRWWYDLNGDDKIDALDHLAYLVIDRQVTGLLDEAFAAQFNLSPERLELLTTHWQTWKPHLSDWQTVYNNPTASRE